MCGLLRIFYLWLGYTGLRHPQLAKDFICQLPASEQVMILKNRNENLPSPFLASSISQRRTEEIYFIFRRNLLAVLLTLTEFHLGQKIDGVVTSNLN